MSLDTVIIVPLVIGITEIYKTIVKRLPVSDKVKEWFSAVQPLFVIISGIGMAFLYSGYTSSAVIDGIIVGLMSMGIWSGSKHTALSAKDLIK